MFNKYRTEAVILDKADRGEADQIFTVYSKDYGRIEVSARGIRKMASKLRAATQVMSLCDVEFIQGKNFKTLTDSLCENRFDTARADLKKIAAFVNISKLTAKLLKNSERDGRVWNLLTETLFCLEESQTEAADAIEHCWNLLSVLGWRPGLEVCCACGLELALPGSSFIWSEKGIACHDCSKKFSRSHAVGADILNLLRIVSHSAPSDIGALRISPFQDKALRVLEDNYFQAVIGVTREYE